MPQGIQYICYDVYLPSLGSNSMSDAIEAGPLSIVHSDFWLKTLE